MLCAGSSSGWAHCGNVEEKTPFVKELKARKNTSLLKHRCSFWYQNDSTIWNVTHREVNDTYHRVVPKSVEKVLSFEVEKDGRQQKLKQENFQLNVRNFLPWRQPGRGTGCSGWWFVLQGFQAWSGLHPEQLGMMSLLTLPAAGGWTRELQGNEPVIQWYLCTLTLH